MIQFSNVMHRYSRTRRRRNQRHSTRRNRGATRRPDRLMTRRRHSVNSRSTKRQFTRNRRLRRLLLNRPTTLIRRLLLRLNRSTPSTTGNRKTSLGGMYGSRGHRLRTKNLLQNNFNLFLYNSVGYFFRRPFLLFLAVKCREKLRFSGVYFVVRSVNFSCKARIPCRLRPTTLYSSRHKKGGRRPHNSRALPSPTFPFTRPRNTKEKTKRPTIRPQTQQTKTRLHKRPILHLNYKSQRLLQTTRQRTRQRHFQPTSTTTTKHRPPPKRSTTTRRPINILPTIPRLQDPRNKTFRRPTTPSTKHRATKFRHKHTRPQRHSLLRQTTTRQTRPTNHTPIIPTPRPTTRQYTKTRHPRQQTIRPTTTKTSTKQRLPRGIQTNELSTQPTTPIRRHKTHTRPNHTTTQRRLYTTSLYPTTILQQKTILLPRYRDQSRPPTDPHLPPRRLPRHPTRNRTKTIPRSNTRTL